MSEKFSEYLEDPAIRHKWEKVRQYFFLRESTYDMTNRCNLRCEGCYYYAGEKSLTPNVTDPEKWRELFKAEKKRGITYVVLAGAEPALVPDLLRAAFEVIPYGTIATNGTIKIPQDIKYPIHISVWGNDQYSELYRNTKNCLKKQLKAYRGDDRAIFVYTFTRQNIEMIKEVIPPIIDAGCKVTFNQFSAPIGYEGELKLDRDARLNMRDTMLDVMEHHGESILYSRYNVEVHSAALSLHDQFSCSYPRMNKNNRVVGLGRTFRQYRSNLTIDNDVACCVPDTDCDDCRHYAAGSAVVTSKLLKHVSSRELFCKWLDYVDTYLSVWVYGYKKSPDLFTGSVQEAISIK